ncbi:MAG: hypothetical protein MUP63_00690 [Candidatus Nanohaloarchaeota archaeon QJJ-7]|nr:hypothetical protein [Candidatus Nanohaloarchaeota archaeon QJJ-7]
MKSKYFMVAFLGLSILLAGCTALPGDDGGDEDGPDTSFRITQNDGLSISFQSLSNSYDEGEPIALRLNLQNTGQKEAEAIQASLYGASFLTGENKELGTLSGADKAAQQPGGQTSEEWRISNPVNLDVGATQDYPAGVRVLYRYSTTSTADMTVVPRADFDEQSTTVTTQNTAGPLKAEFDVVSPKPVSDTEEDSVSVSIPVQIRNVGDGKVANNLEGDEGNVALEVGFANSGEDFAIDTCGEEDGNEENEETGREDVQLYDGSRRVICTASVSPDVFETQLNLEATLEYPYFETQETTFTVEGLEG